MKLYMEATRFLALALTAAGVACGGETGTGSGGTGGGGTGGGAALCTLREPGVGRASGTNELMPGSQRLRAAISPDGITWTRLPGVIADQAATPSLTRTADGRPMLYMTSHQPAGKWDGATVAIGSMDGSSWTHCSLELIGFPSDVFGSDPDVVRLSDGSYRLYITGGIAPPIIGIHYADSPDGLVWTYGGVAFARATSVIDSMTFEVGGSWHMYALENTSIAMAHATSSDGTAFTFSDSSERKLSGKPHVLSQAAMVEGQLRIYGFGPKGQEIRSFTTTDGSTLVEDDRLLLALAGAPPEESVFVKDPAVTALADGSYLMVYSTVIP